MLPEAEPDVATTHPALAALDVSLAQVDVVGGVACRPLTAEASPDSLGGSGFDRGPRQEPDAEPVSLRGDAVLDEGCPQSRANRRRGAPDASQRVGVPVWTTPRHCARAALCLLLLCCAGPALSACDVAIRYVTPVDCRARERLPKVGDPYCGLGVVFSVEGRPSGPVRVVMSLGGQVIDFSETFTPSDRHVRWRSFNATFDGEAPWSVSIDPEGRCGDVDPSNNVAAGTIALQPPSAAMERYLPRRMTAVQTRYMDFVPRSGSVGLIDYLFGEPVPCATQDSIAGFAPPEGATRVLMSPHGLAAWQLVWERFDTAERSRAEGTQSFDCVLYNVRVNREAMERVTWEAMDAPLPQDVRAWREEKLFPSDDPRIVEFVGKYLPADYRASLTPYSAARQLFLGVVRELGPPAPAGVNPTPFEALTGHYGGCGNFSRIYVAALRRIGFAARVPAGWWNGVYPPDSLVHMWTEFYMPGYGWVYADPAVSDGVDPSGSVAYHFGVSNDTNGRCVVTLGGDGRWPGHDIDHDNLQVPGWYWNGGAELIKSDCVLTLVSKDPVQLALESPEVVGGAGTYAQVVLQSPNAVAGAPVRVFTSDPRVAVPETLPAVGFGNVGERQALIPLDTAPVAEPLDVMVTAQLGDGRGASAVVRLLPR